MDLEDRFKLIFVRFGRFRWIRVGMATYLDGCGTIWLTLRGFDCNCADLVGCGRRYVWILSRILLFIAGFNWIIKGFGWLWAALIGFGRIWSDLVGFGWIWAQIRVDF